MDTTKKIALVAHDDKKHDLLEWAKFNKALLIQHELYCPIPISVSYPTIMDTHKGWMMMLRISNRKSW